MAEFEMMELESADLVAKRIKQIKQLLPEVVNEAGIDFEKLRLVLGDEVDENAERYAFTWPGKTDAIRQSQIPSFATLRPEPEKSVNWGDTENLYIEGDNLEVLKLLQHSYHGRVKLIYIDPPYNTGHDFVYKDSFGDTIANYREQASLIDQSNPDTSGRYHADWCSLIYPRLKLARELLSDDGLICISIDDHELTNLTKIADEIFGEQNRIGLVIIKSNPRGSMSSAELAELHEYILIYAKMRSQAEIIGHELTDEMSSEYKYEDENGKYRLLGLRMRGGFWRRSDRPNLYFPIYVNPSTGEISLEQTEGFTEAAVPIQPTTGEDGTWRWSKEKIETDGSCLVAKEVRRGDSLAWDIFQKDYFDRAEGRRTKAKSIWDEPEMNYQNGTTEIKNLFNSTGVFDYSKPVYLIERIMSMVAMQPGDIVMDFFSGSGTTAHAVMALNSQDGLGRRFILVQLPEKMQQAYTKQFGFNDLCQVGEERIRRAGAKIAAEIEETNKQLRLGEEPKSVPDIGFRVLKLDESGIERPKPGELLLDVVKPDRTDEDIIFEMMLKWGLELTLPIEKVDAAGYPCYSVAYGELVCCLAPGLNMQVLDAIANMEPRRVLMLDRNLDDTAKLNAVQAFKRVEEKTGREVELRTV